MINLLQTHKYKVIGRLEKPLILLLLISAQLHVFGQTDSLENSQLDSALVAQQQRTGLLLSQADSVRIQDSLAQAVLTAQIAALQATDERRRQELQQQLDSLRQAQDARALRIRSQVDSLRYNTVGAPVILYQDTLFYIFAKLGPFSPSDRAASIANKLEILIEKRLYNPSSLTVLEGEESSDVVHADLIVLSITDRDAFWAGKSREAVAEEYAAIIRQSITDYYARTGIFNTLKRLALLVVILLVFFFGVQYLNRALIWSNTKLLAVGKPFIKGIKLRNYEFLSAEQEEQWLERLLKLLRWLIIAVVIYLVLPVMLSVFPATQNIATALFGYILNPLKKFGIALVGYIPEMITIIVILLVTYYSVRLLRFFALEVERGHLTIPGFYPDWASPTFNLLRFLIYIFAVVIIFPYLPNSDSPIFQGMSIFLGLLISLGSSSAISNIIAGLVITYMRAFRIGDRVKISDTTGDVIEKTMLVTRVRTIKNEDVTIPNSAILSGTTVNYSSSAKQLGLILNTGITIGYDVPWRKVHELMINAALKTEHIKKTPKPFVLQTSLDDFYVSYQINAYTEEAGKAAKIYSELYGHIQDGFNEAGVEIMSPHYRAVRDGGLTTIPADYLPKDYKAPSINVNISKDENGTNTEQ